MRTRNISHENQTKVFKYLEYVAQEESEGFAKGMDILNKISKQIKEDIYTEYFGSFLKKNKFFKLNFSLEFINRLSMFVKEKSLGP